MTPDGRPGSWRELWRLVQDEPVRRRNMARLVLPLAFCAVILLALVAAAVLAL